MRQVRIRAISNGVPSPWIYSQEQVKQVPIPEQPKAKSNFSIMAAPVKSKTNQYGRFRYNEKQYGILVSSGKSKIEISKIPIRIKKANGDFLYVQQAQIEGACPAIRIRSRGQNETSPWVYTRSEEV